MKEALVALAVAIFASGCERPMVVDPGTDSTAPPTETRLVVVLEGFGQEKNVVAGVNGVRVGMYHDFSFYDSLLITFSAKRLTSYSSFDRIIVRIGPSCYLYNSLYTAQTDVSLLVRRSDIAKSHSAALSFRSGEMEAEILLSNLRVVGWTNR